MSKDVNNYSADISARLLDDFTALHLATDKGHLEIVSILIDSGADVNSRTKIGRTPLHLASIRGFYEICKLLL